jgi:hypothetical protein
MIEPRRAVVFLQNAWSPSYAGGEWPRESWLWALYDSQSGKRLQRIAGQCEPDVTLIYDNTTPIVGAEPRSRVPPDYEHMLRVLHRHNPHYVVACGAQAARAIDVVRDRLLPSQRMPLIIAPHPACRVLTNACYEQLGRLLKTGFVGEVQLVQERGHVALRMRERGSDADQTVSRRPRR